MMSDGDDRRVTAGPQSPAIILRVLAVSLKEITATEREALVMGARALDAHGEREAR
jgi:hypothetical protein